MLLQRQQLASKYLGAAGMSVVADCGTLGMEMWSPLTLKLVQSLPYSLTKSQIKAVSEIMWDLQRPIPMNRLLQVHGINVFFCGEILQLVKKKLENEKSMKKL
jgi:hypothetical protein